MIQTSQILLLPECSVGAVTMMLQDHNVKPERTVYGKANSGARSRKSRINVGPPDNGNPKTLKSSAKAYESGNLLFWTGGFLFKMQATSTSDLFCSSEAAPYVRIGKLATMAGGNLRNFFTRATKSANPIRRHHRQGSQRQ